MAQNESAKWQDHRRIDGAEVCRGGYNAQSLPWEAQFPRVPGQLFSRQLLTRDGRVRRFATAEAAMRAMDKAFPVKVEADA